MSSTRQDDNDTNLYKMSFVDFCKNYNSYEFEPYYYWAECHLSRDEIQLITESESISTNRLCDVVNVIDSVFCSVNDHCEDDMTVEISYDNDKFFAMCLLICRHLGMSDWLEARPASISVVYSPNCSVSEMLMVQLLVDDVPFVHMSLSEWENMHQEGYVRFPFATVPQIKIEGTLLKEGYTEYMRVFHESDYSPDNLLKVQGINGTALVAVFILMILRDNDCNKEDLVPIEHNDFAFYTPVSPNLHEAVLHLRTFIQNFPSSSYWKTHFATSYNTWEKWIRYGATKEHEQIRSFINALKATGYAPFIDPYF